MTTSLTDPDSVPEVLRNDAGAPVGIVEKHRWTPPKIALWVAIGLLGGLGWTMIAIVRGEQVNTIWFIVASVCTYSFAYRFYARFIERRLMRPDDRRATPAERIDNGKDFDPTDRRVLFGHHFAAIAGAGPLVGPVLAAQMGYLPGTMWIIFGVVVAGGVQDMLVLFFSLRRGGRSLGQMARDEIGRVGGTIAMVVVFVMMMIVLAVLALVVVNALAESPWGVFSIGCTIPIALFMGVYLRFIRPGRVTEISLVGFVLLIAAIVGGRYVAESSFGEVFHLSPVALTWALIIYGFGAAVLPVWLLLTPRDYLSTFMKVGTILVLAAGIVVVMPMVQMPAVTEFASNGEGPVFSGSLFPFLFITIACGALSGLHATVASGTTPKMVQKESQVRLIGYGGMLMESFVAIMALVAAISLNQGVYFAMNMPEAMTQGTTQGAVEAVDGLGITDIAGDPVEVSWETEIDGELVTLTGAEALDAVASDVGEPSVVSKTGGAPTLAVGMANILHNVFGGKAMMSFWYHFAIMFEALFILTTVDAGTRVARFMLSDSLGNWVPRFRNPSWRLGSWLSTAVVVGAWGALLMMGVTDPLGGIRTLFPLFGIANQLLAAAALTIVTVMVVRRGYVRWVWIPLVPLVWDVVVTFTASWQKIFSDVPAIGYFAQRSLYQDRIAAGEFTDAAALADAEAVVRNTPVQGTLSIVFVLMVAALLVTAARAVWVALRSPGEVTTSEDPFEESSLFAPQHLLATPAEKELEAEVAAGGRPTPRRGGHDGHDGHGPGGRSPGASDGPDGAGR